MTAVETPKLVLSRQAPTRDDNVAALASLVTEQLELLGEDPNREGLLRTPASRRRVAFGVDERL
jgi:GTP cyclohydrolase I